MTKKLIAFLLLFAAGAFGQPAVTFSITSTGPIRPGTSVQVQALLSGSVGLNLDSVQAFLSSTAGGTWSAAAGPASAAAAKAPACANVANSFNCVLWGMNANVLSDGVVVQYTLDIPANATPNQQVTIGASNLMAANAAGDAVPLTANSLTFTLGSPSSQCDLNGDGTVTQADANLMRDQVQGVSPCVTDLDGDGKCLAPDLTRVKNAALGGICRVTGK